MPPKPQQMEREVLDDGWIFVCQVGSHRQYIHPDKPGKVTIPFHKGKELKLGTVNAIRKQAGLNNRSRNNID